MSANGATSWRVHQHPAHWAVVGLLGKGRRVTRLAQRGRVNAAIGEYLKCALDGEKPGMELLDDPVYREVCDDAMWYVFAGITSDYQPTPEREAYIQRHCAGRPITLAMLQSAWAACQFNEQRHQRGELLDQYQRPGDACSAREP